MPPIPPFIEPDWPAPANVLELSTTRGGGCSARPYDSLNLAHHVGDSDGAVGANRDTLSAVLPSGGVVSWLSQVHGTRVLEAGQGGLYPEADAQWSRSLGAPCAVMTADCLPVLFCSAAGDVVAAAHAGWRGLSAGVLEATVRSMRTQTEGLLVWLGPAIGPAAFEVGAEVRTTFLASAGSTEASAVEACFRRNPGRPGYYYADLYALARVRLGALGVHRFFGGGFCTHSDTQRFFSYRRDGKTGRMASLILLRE